MLVSRIAKNLPKWKRKPSERNAQKHLAFIHQLPCIACGAAAPSEAAHVRKSTNGGVGIKPADRFCCPLCRGCHREQHNIGEVTFWARLRIDPLIYAARLWAVSGDLAQGQRVIFRAHQASAMNSVDHDAISKEQS